jgi:uncharacterized protein (DUF885 family)
MFSRRDILKKSASVGIGAIGVASGIISLANAAEQTSSTALATVLDGAFNDLLKLSPGLCTSIGADKGELAFQKSKLDHVDKQSRDRYLAFGRALKTSLQAIDRNSLQGMDRINYDTVLWDASHTIDGANRFQGTSAGGNPYQISQLTGSYQSTPDFLASQHTVENRADAEAYIARILEFGRVLNEETDNFNEDCAMGLTPPDFILRRTLEQLNPMVNKRARDSSLVTSFEQKLKEKQIGGNYLGRAEALVGGAIRRALVRQADAVRAKLNGASSAAGIWRLPQGAERYEYAIKGSTTTNMTANEVHQLGLQKVAEITSQINTILNAQGITEGTPGQRMAALNNDPRQHYPNNDAGKAELLRHLNHLVEEIYKKVPDYYNVLPKAKLEIKRVPVEVEAGAPGGYYNSGALDGSRAGAYYINLRDTKEQPKWLLPTLTFHEGVPGHHFQIAIQQEAALPMLRKIQGFNAYAEGWALYSEQVADEMGMYENDPFGKVGMLHDALFRAVRLVVDSGMHAKRWSRDQAINYMAQYTGDQVSAATTEIERYCVWPGQALGYMVGKIEWLRLREQMRSHMGARFSIKDFHDAGLLAGSVPLTVLEQVYRDKGYIG